MEILSLIECDIFPRIHSPRLYWYVQACVLYVLTSTSLFSEGMWLILQQETPEDFVLATGEMHTVREFVEKSFAITGVQIRFVYETLLCVLSMVENLF